MREQGCRAVVKSKKREEWLREQEAEQLLRVQREKKSCGNNDVNSCLELAERRRVY